MKRIHLALSTDNIEGSIKDYSQRLGLAPEVVVAGEYALWRTESLNLSIRRDIHSSPGSLRHLGWEDPQAEAFAVDTDVNGIVWEYFNAMQQADEINAAWPATQYLPQQH